VLNSPGFLTAGIMGLPLGNRFHSIADVHFLANTFHVCAHRFHADLQLALSKRMSVAIIEWPDCARHTLRPRPKPLPAPVIKTLRLAITIGRTGNDHARLMQSCIERWRTSLPGGWPAEHAAKIINWLGPPSEEMAIAAVSFTSGTGCSTCSISAELTLIPPRFIV